jgi:hypothetical protein
MVALAADNARGHRLGGEPSRPFLGVFFALEDCEETRRPRRFGPEDEPSIQELYGTAFRGLIDDDLYDAVCYVTTARPPDFSAHEPVPSMGFSMFLDKMVSHVAVGGVRRGRVRSEVFLCHSSGDKKQVAELHRSLAADGFNCWFDEESLLPGHDWDLEIGKAIRRSRFVLACLSSSSVVKRGYVQKELRRALDVADEQPDGSIFLIPVLFEPCEVPERLQHLHRVDLSVPEGYNRLVRALRLGEGLVSSGEGIADDDLPMHVLPLISQGRQRLEGGGSNRSSSGNTVRVDGDSRRPLYVGNGNVIHAASPAQGNVAAVSGAVTGGDEPTTIATVQPAQFDRWSALPPEAARLALRARDQSSIYNSPMAAGGKPAEFRFLWRIACTELSAARRAKQISDALLTLLGSPAMTNALARHIDIGGLAWTRYGDHSRTSFGAVLRAVDDDGEPAAWARFSPPPAPGYQLFGRESGCTDLVLAVRFGDGGGPSGRPASLTSWSETFTTWFETFPDVGTFLGGLGVDLTAQPATRAAVAISTRTDLSEVVDLASVPLIPGTSVAAWFHTVAAADPTGMPTGDVSSEWLATMCEDALHVDDYDSVLGR